MALIRDNFDLQKEYAKKVALNLYNYMLSFEKVSDLKLNTYLT